MESLYYFEFCVVILSCSLKIKIKKMFKTDYAKLTRLFHIAIYLVVALVFFISKTVFPYFGCSVKF